MEAGLIRQLADQPEPVPWLDSPGWRTGHRSGVCIVSGFWGAARGLGDTVIGDLAVQHLIVLPDPQPTAAAAMTNHISGEFVRGDNNVISTTLRQAGLDGVGGYEGSQPVQRVAIKGLLQDRLDPAGRRHVRWRIRCAAG
jgi:hypothetical protein